MSDWTEFNPIPTDQWAQFQPQSAGTLVYGGPGGEQRMVGGPDINIPATGDEATRAARLIGQGAQSFNDAAARAALLLPDASALLSRKTGLVNPNTPSPSDAAISGMDYLATAPGRARDALAQGSTSPFLEQRTSRFEPQNEAERLAGDIGGAGGSVFGSLVPLGAYGRYMPKNAPGQNVVNAMASHPLAQAGGVAAGNVVGRETGIPELGIATTMATPLAMQAGQRLAHAAPTSLADTAEANRREMLEFGRSLGTMPTAGNITKKPWLQTLESWVENLPLPGIGGKIAQAQAENRNAWQKTILEKAGDTSGATAATSDYAQGLVNKAGATVGNILKPYNIKITPALGPAMDKIESKYGSRLLADVKEGVMDRIKELRSSADALQNPGVHSVSIKGETFQNIRSDLTSLAMNHADHSVRRAAGEMVGALDDMAMKSVPPDVWGDYAKARQQYRNALAVRESVQGQHNEQTGVGNIPPGRFAKEAEQNDDLKQLGQYGQTMVGDKAENVSKTARHNYVSHIASAGLGALGLGAHNAGIPLQQMAMAAGGAAIPYGIVAGMNSSPMRALLLARYRNSAPGFAASNPAMFGSLAGQGVLQESK